MLQFTKFTYKDIGSGGYVYEYPMKNNEYLYIIGYDLNISPKSIYIISEIKEKISIK